MRIRRLPAEDHGLVLDLDARLFVADSERPAVDANTAWWVVENQAGNVVGYAGAMLWEPDKAVYLHRAGLFESARGKGLHRRLIRVRERWGRLKGCSISYTYTSHANVASANNLIGCGYKLWTPSTWGGSRYPMQSTADGAWLYWARDL